LNKSWYNHYQGSVKTWGDSNFGGKDAPNAPTDKGYIKIYSTDKAFAGSGAFSPPKCGLPHALIEPSPLMAAKAILLA
jgi:hypothetical protein